MSDQSGVAVSRGKELRIRIGSWEFGVYAARKARQEDCHAH